MPAELSLPSATVFGFLLVLARVAGIFVFVPLPGIKSGPEISRVALALSITLILFPQWPEIPAGATGLGQLTGWLLAEAALGITIGLAVAFLIEIFVLAAQIISMQAGYAYASTIDPTTQADSGVLLVIAQLGAGMLFFALGFDRHIIRILAETLRLHPPGTFHLTPLAVEHIGRLGALMFSTGLRLAMPALALLVLVDVALALLGRVNAQLQLLSLAFPLKMLAALALLGYSVALFPTIYKSAGTVMDAALHAVLGR